MAALTDHLAAAELDKLLKLPTSCRAELAHRLIDSLEPPANAVDAPSSDYDADAKAFTEMIEARSAKAHSQPESLSDVESVVKRVRANLERLGA